MQSAEGACLRPHNHKFKYTLDDSDPIFALMTDIYIQLPGKVYILPCPALVGDKQPAAERGRGKEVGSPRPPPAPRDFFLAG